MSMLDRKSLILAKLEDNAGVDSQPTAADAILIANLSIEALQGNAVNRDTYRPFLGARGSILPSTYSMLKFDVAFAGAGGKDTPPGWGRLLRGCGFAETITTGNSVVYNPVSDGFESLTLYGFKDKILHKMPGTRGDVTLSLQAGELPKFSFDFTGLYEPAEKQDQPSNPNFDLFQTPKGVNRANTPLVNLHGYDCVLDSLTVELGNVVTFTDRPNSRKVSLTDRAMKGSLSLEMPDLDVKNYFAEALNHTDAPLNITHGTEDGNIIELACPKVQITGVNYGESNGVLMANLDVEIKPTDAGNDEFIITTR